MPELPEVETIKIGLQKKIIGLKLKSIEVLGGKTAQFNPEILRGKKVLNVWRRAKMLGVDLGGEESLVFHLKMTGQLILVSKDHGLESRVVGGHPTSDMKGQMPNSSTRAVFEFEDPLRPRSEASGSKLYFNDQRKFGWIKLFKTDEVKADDYKKLGELGPEALDPQFTWEMLKANLLKHKNKPVKVAILDQSVVAGVGNIYAAESLFLARIDPRRKVATLSDEEFQKLFQGIREALETGIKHGGSTRAHFVNIEGERGYFLDYANVYGKEGQKCRGCPGKIVKITQTGRGTYFCPSCQH
jgi:formamidopyrimidine-DNA glycosylase